jgi:transglutaminase-like putative cysteine protease
VDILIVIKKLGWGFAWCVLLILVGVPLYAVPATLSLPRGLRPGLEPLTIDQAAVQLQKEATSGWALVEEARSLVGKRMAYSRRNSFDTAGKAFERGYGYCTQHAFALVDLLTRLGFEAKVVQAFKNRFSDGKVTSHAWVRVTLEGETRYIDPLFFDEKAGRIDFSALSPITEFPPLFKVFAWWGGTAINAHRYYLTGVDFP